MSHSGNEKSAVDKTNESEEPPVKRKMMEKEEELDLLSLPDEMIVKILSYMNFSERSKMRLNKKLFEVEAKVRIVEKEEGWKEKRVKVVRNTHRELSDRSDEYFLDKGNQCFSDVLSMDVFERLAKNVHLRCITVRFPFDNDTDFDVLTRLSSICKNQIKIEFADETPWSTESNDNFTMDHIRSLLSSTPFVDIAFICDGLTYQDVLSLREEMRKMEVGRISACVAEDVARSISTRLLGVEFGFFTIRGHECLRRVPRTDDLIEIYEGEKPREISVHTFDGLVQIALCSSTSNRVDKYQPPRAMVLPPFKLPGYTPYVEEYKLSIEKYADEDSLDKVRENLSSDDDESEDEDEEDEEEGEEEDEMDIEEIDEEEEENYEPNVNEDNDAN